ncbi:EAL domain-containing protein [Pseudorhodoferax sp. Leaf267]|uniref:EAL domain-containing protein n=1 Tax=Pseudorhodoferax sp. Leaf267 TaxID=1736316 RepID=UPI0006F3EC20|nr:EAL domain-containing protein [Pseudorhodoferax sp. Leaf267]KQP18015.1 hypothetical protein ASF43_09155 [Pseudorhodoferax sp. Leaf267]
MRATWWWAGAATVLLLAWWHPPGLQRLDLLAYDLLLPDSKPSARAPMVLAIDDASLARLGSWPWPRALHARMLDQLTQAGASSIGIAVLFAEPDRRDPAGDAALQAAIARHGRVALAVAPSRQPDGSIARELLQPRLGDGPLAYWLGHVDVEIDLDGQSRSLFLRAGLNAPSLPALALAVHELAAPTHDQSAAPPLLTPPAASDQVAWVRRDEAFPPRMEGLPRLSFADALDNPALADAVRGRSVFIGVTASGLGAYLATPLAPAAHTPLPAIVFHAQTFEALQTDALIARVSAPLALAFALLAISSLALWPRGEGRGPLPARVLLGGTVLCLPLLASAGLLALQRLWLPPALSMLALAVALAFREAGKLRAINRQLQRSRQHAQAALQAIDDAVITLDAQHQTIRFANPTALLQASPQVLEGARLADAYPLTEDSLEPLQAAITTCLAQAHSVHVLELLHLRAPDGPRSLRATASPLRSADGRIDGVVLVFADVTSALAAAREREHAATHDTLTGLPNRALLHERLQRTLARVQRQGSMAAILFVDLDRFKHVNDSLGHRTGEEVLKVLAQRLRDTCRDTDTVARWGGDEFVLILEDVGSPEGAAMAAAKIVEALSWDIALGPDFNDRRLPSAGSVGVVLVPRDGTQIEDLMSKADMAMYRAKSQPKASFHIWASDIDAGLHDRLALEVDLRQALQEGQLLLHYQPQYALDRRRLVGMEALMRWQRGPGHLVLPAEFIHIAEESGLIIDMGGWAVLQTARQIAAWLGAGLQPPPVAVNISGRQCLNHEIVQVVRAALRETGIPPQLLKLEITETTAMTDGDHVIGLLREIRALGVGLSLDDFGTGYSSLAYLKHFPLNEIKIDRSFVGALPDSRNDAAIVHATIALARGLGLQVVAEGVETEAQNRFLAARGCHSAQGHLYGGARSAGETTGLLR